MTTLHVSPFNLFSANFNKTSGLTQENKQASVTASELLLPVQSHASTNSIVFIDSRLPDFEQLLAAVPVGTTVVILDKTQDGLQQIAAALKDYQNLDSISIISHGADGLLLLGNAALHESNLANYQSELDVINNALNASGDLLLYGCNVAAGIKGQNFIQALALATNADIAASTNDTGTAERGGDWILEISTGSIDSKQSFINTEQIIDWNHLAATLSASDLASLQAAMAMANANGLDDTLTLTGDILFTANNNTINIAADSGHSITIIGSKNNSGGTVTIDGGNLTRVFNVASGAKASLENLVITNGLAAGNGGDNTGNVEGPGRAGFDGSGGGIYNAGELVINNSTVTANKASGGGGTGGGYPRGGGGGGGGGFGDGLGGIGGKDRVGEMPTSPSPGHGGNGSGTNGGQRGGFGGSDTGGAGGGATVMFLGPSYTVGGAGATANNGTMSIGGGGGGSGGIYVGGAGGSAVGGIFNSGTLKITNSTISNNIAAGGGGGGGAAANYSGTGNGGAGGKGIGGIWSTGTLLMDAASVTTLSTGNKGVGGLGGTIASLGDAQGVNGISINGILGTVTPYSTPATVSINLSQTTLKAGDTQGLTFTFSEAVTDFGSADIYIANGVLSGLQTSDNITYTAIFTPNAHFESANNQISVNLAGTYNSTNTPGVGITHSSNFVVDTKLPTLSINSSNTNLKAGETATITFNFSEAATGFAANDVAVTGGILSNFGGSGSSYSATFTPTAGTNQGSANLSVVSGSYTDAVGNSSAAGSSLALAFDTSTPTISSVSVPTNATYALGQHLDFTVNFNETVVVTGLPSIPVTLDSGGTVNATYLSGSNSSALTFRYTIANGNTDTNGITLGTSIAANGGNITDVAGNNATLTLNSVGSTVGILVDGVAPSVLSINRVSSTPTNASTVDFQITFSENIANGGVSLGDFALFGTGTANGNIASVFGSNSTWTVRVDSISGDGTLRLDLKSSGTGITDSAGNAIAGGYTSGQIYTIDRVMPMVSSIAPTDLVSTNAASCSFTVTFSENVSGVDITDFVVTATNTASASIASIAGSGKIYTVVLNNVAGDGNLRLDLKSSGTNIVDMQGNTISTGFTNGSTIAVDRIAPTLANPIEISDTVLKIGDASTMTINFTEAVVNLDASDFNFSSGSLSNFVSSNGG
ncbi:Ig-like domain-containing protein, partial [Undibacterium amnicola]